MKQLINSTSEPGWPNIEVEYHKPVELFIDNFHGYDVAKDTFKILWLRESEDICKLTAATIENKDKFDAIITTHEDVLRECSNSHLMEFGTSWIDNFDITTQKEFKVSHLTGHKDWTEGHRLRKKVYYKQDKIHIPKDFYISKYGGVENHFNSKVLGESKNPMFDSQFHICIENTRQKNYFTEKVIDCFVTKTIPIYYGCENIEKFFDADGFYIANNFNDIIDICNSLDENSYQDKLKFVEKNFELAKKYTTIIDRLESILNNILKNSLNS